MTDYRPDVTEALLAAGWTRTTRGGELRNGDIHWRAMTQPGDSAIRNGTQWIAEFVPHCPAIVIVAACLAAAGQPVGQLADDIATRAATLHEYALVADAPLQADADQLAGTDVPALLAEIRRLRTRTLTEAEHDRAWHAIEGAAGEEGADPGTVLNAVLRALGITAP